MEGQDFAVVGVVEGKDNLVIVDEHGVQENFDQPLLAVDVGVGGVRVLGEVILVGLYPAA